MILGPIVQYYAFGDLWTGIPFGWDLTDNKTLIALIFWILAVVNEQKERETTLYSLSCTRSSPGIFNTSQFIWFRVRLHQRTGNSGIYSLLFLKFYFMIIWNHKRAKRIFKLYISTLSITEIQVYLNFLNSVQHLKYYHVY